MNSLHPRRSGLLARVSCRYRAWRLARRLQRVEAELLELTARQAGVDGDRQAPISREVRTVYESRCMERALLRARIDWCRASG